MIPNVLCMHPPIICNIQLTGTYKHSEWLNILLIKSIFNSYTMDMSDLPDIYTQSKGPQAQGLRVYILGESRVHMI